MSWGKVEILNQEGETVLAQTPVIVSASRSTDIPTFYADWFVERWKAGYVKRENPFNGTPLYITFKNTKVVVFWTKNPKPIMKHLNFLDKNGGIKKTKKIKDKGQRESCGCIMSKDIGEYNTCPHECVYCHANTSKEIALANYKTHTENPTAETITGK